MIKLILHDGMDEGRLVNICLMGNFSYSTFSWENFPMVKSAFTYCHETSIYCKESVDEINQLLSPYLDSP